jgi:adenylate kinase
LNQEVTIFIFIGPPGSGKGTLADLCTKRFGWLQISTGNLCRKHIAEQTEIGKEIDLIIKSGKLINDDLITSMVVDWLSENAQEVSGIILDGYPRTVVQARDFDNSLNALYPQAREKVVLFSIPDDVVINRLCRRFVCQNKDCQAIYSTLNDSQALLGQEKLFCKECGFVLGRRPDDEESSIKKRLVIYHKHKQDLIDYYSNQGTEFIEIDASKPLKEVFESFLQNVEEK